MWTVEKIQAYYDELNKAYGLQVVPVIREAKKGKSPLFVKNGELMFIPAFFNHPELDETVKMMLLTELYSCFHIDRRKTGYVDVNPGFMAKGICLERGVDFASDDEIEQNLRKVRRQLYDEIEYCCYFSVGQKLRESAFVSWEVVGITRNGIDDILVTVKPIGCNLGKPERTMTEEELYKRCCNFRDMKNEKVDMRRNLVVISGPSGVGKDSVVKKLLEKYPHLHKTTSVTTRTKRGNEVDGANYYYVSKEQFYDLQTNDSLVEYTLYDGEYYGTFYSEIERHPDDVPLLLVIDGCGRRSLMMRYPMAKTIFIAPPSLEELKARLIARGENSDEEMERRLTVAKDELEQAYKYDFTVVNEEVESCAEEIAKIISKTVLVAQ